MSSPSPGPSILKRAFHSLDAIFQPRTVAVIGATENQGAVGRTVLWNLVAHPFGGVVYPVSLKRASVLGIRAYPTIAQVPERVDLAVIVTPAASVPEVMHQCVEAGVRGAVVISAGFKERGAEGAQLEQRVLEQASRGGIRVIGPNCLGVMRPPTGLNATFASTIARPGNVAFISQSGALCTAILDWSLHENFGFSAFVSIGSMADVGWGDLIDYLGDDPYTKSILIYMESIDDARSFLSAAREVAMTKPIILIKSGRTQAAAQAAASHTGALSGSDEVLDAACRRTGILRVDSLEDLFFMAGVLARQPRPRGPRLTIVTNAGGPGVLATDALIRSRGELATLADTTIEKLNPILPAAWSHSNPIDILGDAPPERYFQSLQIAAEDPASDGLLAILTPQAMSDPTATAEQLKGLSANQNQGKPILACWMGGDEVEAGRLILNRAGIPTFPFPDTAARLFTHMWQYSYNLQGLYETPAEASDPLIGAKPAGATRIIEQARAAGRKLLTEAESKALLAEYGIPTVETRVAVNETEAVALAEQIGFPVVLKLYSRTITHKTDVGGVRLNLASPEAVRQAYRGIKASVGERAGAQHFEGVTVQPMVKLEGYELILGSSIDPQFGPVLLFGAGGQLVEVMRDRALALPPLNTTLARRMIEQTRIYQALRGVRGRDPIDLPGLERLLVRFSQLVAEQPWIAEIDINPLLVSPERLLALDARVVLHDPALSEDKLPRPAIRPYPIQYIWPYTSKDGASVTIRPIRPEDEPAMIHFHETLSERSVYLRFFHVMKLSTRVEHERLRRRCFIDYDREMALVVDYKDPDTQEKSIVGVGRLTRLRGTRDSEFAIIVSDPWQHRGLGAELLRRLVEIGRLEGVDRIKADILPDNLDMQRVCEHIGFRLWRSEKEEVIKAELNLTEPQPATATPAT